MVSLHPPRSVVDTGLAAGLKLASASAKRLEQNLDRRRLGAPPARIGDALRDGHTSGWKEVDCAFALSTGRAGSKTLAALWALSPGVMGVHEPLPRQVQVSSNAWLDPTAPSLQTTVYAARDDLIADAWRRGLLWAETNNRLTSLAPALAAAFPAARFVHLWRNPEPFIKSGLARDWYSGHNWDFARWQPRPDDPVAEIWPMLPSLDRIAWLWAATNEFITDFAAENPQRVMTLGTDTMLAGETDAITGIYDVVGAEPPPREMVLRVLGKKINSGPGTGEALEPWFDGLAPAVRDLVGMVADGLGARVR